MDSNSFWLADISHNQVSVSLISKSHSYQVVSNGPEVDYAPESFITSFDKSLSQAAESAKIDPQQEPDSVALIIPPFWVGNDGRILSERLKLFESLFKEMKLKPMGFISFDEAIVEEANQTDGFPASFVLVNFNSTSFTVSLVYLGKVIERQQLPLNSGFVPEMLEKALLNFKSDSTLPPQIILTGHYQPEYVESIKSYPWIGKKNIETFLHFPDIKTYSRDDLTKIYTKVISSQFQPLPPQGPAMDSEDETTNENVSVPAFEADDTPVDIPDSPDALNEVSADELGFITADNLVVPEVDQGQDVEDIQDDQEPEISPPETPASKKIKLPNFSFPKIALPGKNLFLLPVAILPALILVPFYFSKATITLYITPYNFSKTINATFDPTVQDVDLSKNIIPINMQNYDVATSAVATTTDEKTVGEKAQGELVAFNKLDKVQTLAKGTIATDDQGRKFELLNSAQIASSSSDLENGVITLGKTKVMVIAADIGPDYNLPKDSVLHFKDISDSVLVARVSQGLSGGTKKQISAVAASDKSALDSQLTAAVNDSINSRLGQETNDRSGIVKELTYIKKGRIDYNREVGEEADELVGNITSTVYLYFFDNNQKQKILTKLFSSEPNFSEVGLSPDSFNFQISNPRTSPSRPSAQVTINVEAQPKVNTAGLVGQLSGKSEKSAADIIKKTIPRVYNFEIKRNFSFLNKLNPLPFRTNNITFVVK